MSTNLKVETEKIHIVFGRFSKTLSYEFVHPFFGLGPKHFQIFSKNIQTNIKRLTDFFLSCTSYDVPVPK